MQPDLAILGERGDDGVEAPGPAFEIGEARVGLQSSFAEAVDRINGGLGLPQPDVAIKGPPARCSGDLRLRRLKRRRSGRGLSQDPDSLVHLLKQLQAALRRQPVKDILQFLPRAQQIGADHPARPEAAYPRLHARQVGLNRSAQKRCEGIIILILGPAEQQGVGERLGVQARQLLRQDMPLDAAEQLLPAGDADRLAALTPP